MKNGNYSKAKILTLIPVIVLIFTVICLVLATILEVPTSKGILYTLFAFAGLMGIFIPPLPCLLLSIIGTMYALKATKEGAAEARKFLILGILELIVCAVGVVLAILMFIVGQGV